MSDKEFDTYFNDKHAHLGKWEVTTLANAVEMIKDEIRDNEKENAYYRED
jgi:hypothetical protein